MRTARSLRNNRGRDVISYRSLANEAAGNSGGGGVPPSAVPSNAYVAEDGITPYVTEDGSQFYVTES